MTGRLSFLATIALAGLCVGCHPVKPEMSVEGVPQACCTVANPELTHFEGCRIPRRNCHAKKGEKWWMRGAVRCGAVDEASCQGGRCCEYIQQYDPSIGKPIENWAPPGHDKPTNNVTDPDAKPQHDVPVPDATPDATASEPPADEAGDAPTSEPEPAEGAPKPAEGDESSPG